MNMNHHTGAAKLGAAVTVAQMRIRQLWRDFNDDERGLTTLEMVLLAAGLAAIAIAAIVVIRNAVSDTSSDIPTSVNTNTTFD